MPKIYPIIKRIVVQGGDTPAGAAVMTDSFKLEVKIAESIAAQTDIGTFHIVASYTDPNASLTELVKVAITQDDTISVQQEAIGVQVFIPETLAAQLESTKVLVAFAESIAAQVEALRIGVSGYSDANALPSEVLSGAALTWNDVWSGNGGVTNPTNGQGQNNGTLANVKCTGIPTTTPGDYRLRILRASIIAGGSKSIVAYYRTNREGTGLLDSFTLEWTNGTSGTPLTITLPEGDFLTTPFTQAITDIGTAGNPEFRFVHAAAVALTSGSIDVDAVCIRSTGAL